VVVVVVVVLVDAVGDTLSDDGNQTLSAATATSPPV